MYLLDKHTINKIILILLVVAVLISSTIALIYYVQNKNEQMQIASVNADFLNLISEGKHEASLNLWPEVFTSSKDNTNFLNTFSDRLYEVYYNYYNEKYLLNNSKTQSLYETARIYFDFISLENFNKLNSLIYEQYFNEIIDYETFLAVENDFTYISRFSSTHLSDILNQALQIQTARETYNNALLIAESETPDYLTAINQLNLVTPGDTLYYPRAILKMDEYIIKLRDEVKNNTN